MLGRRQVLTVSQLVDKVRFQLETTFEDIWVKGEVSNVRQPPSGHCYFTLKDRDAQIRAVCFRRQLQILGLVPQDGMDLKVRGGMAVYPPRGEFQIVVEFMEPAGRGALQAAFERLKGRLQAEGLFDPEHKQPLPRLPACVGVVTSPGGAAIQDILRVLERRNNRLDVLIYPAQVQGKSAASQIAHGIAVLDGFPQVDVIIVGRGGGSLEDLWPFNEEVVARALYGCRTPSISAVGHQTDFTIADFVADLRAPTPSAAAEIVSAARDELEEQIEHLRRRLIQAARLVVGSKRNRFNRLAASRVFVDAESRLHWWLQGLDDLRGRLDQSVALWLLPRRQRLEAWSQRLHRRMTALLQARRQLLLGKLDQVQAYSPLAVLERGYAIVTDRRQRVVRHPSQVKGGERLEIRVAGGRFGARKEGNSGGIQRF